MLEYIFILMSGKEKKVAGLINILLTWSMIVLYVPPSQITWHVQYLSSESRCRTQAGGSTLKAELVEGDTVPLLKECKPGLQVATHCCPVLKVCGIIDKPE